TYKNVLHSTECRANRLYPIKVNKMLKGCEKDGIHAKDILIIFVFYAMPTQAKANQPVWITGNMKFETHKSILFNEEKG
ncbi:MAG: hypothetical protein ACPHW5_09265, partial [Candidatus Puniceispirillales bacterium]